MKTYILAIALAVFALSLGAQTAPVQKSNTKPPVQQTQPVFMPKTKVKPVDVKPVQTQPEATAPQPNDDSIAAAEAEALRRAHAWLSPFSNYGLMSVENMAHLKSLDLSVGSPTVNGMARTYYMCDDSLVHLLAFKELELINVPTWMGNKGLNYVTQLPALKKLYLGDSKISNAALIALPPMPNVTTLVLYGTPLNNTFMNTIGTQFPNLEILNIGGTGISNAGLAAMPAYPNLRNLILARGNFTDACIPDILKHPNLQLISVEYTQITAAGRQQIKDHFPGITIIPD